MQAFWFPAAEVVAIYVHDRMTTSLRNQPAVRRKGRDESCDKRNREAHPEKQVGRTGLHGARNHQHDRIIDNLHDGDRQRVGGKR